MKKRWMALLAAASLTAGCGTLLDPSAAAVGDREIPLDEVESASARFERCDQFEELTRERPAGEVTREYEQTLLSRLIRRAVLETEAADAGISVSSVDVGERLQQIRDDFDSEKAFQDELKAQCVTLEEVRAFVRDSELERLLRAQITEGIGPTEDELLAEYESRADDFSQIDVSHILVSGKAEAGRLYRRLQDTPESRRDATFARLAEEFSTDAGSASQGGDLGYLSPSDVVPEFSDAALALRPGQISEPVKSQFGWHIIRLNDTRVQAFEEVRAQLEEEIGGQEQESAWEEFLEEAYLAADIEVNPRFGRLDPETQLVTNDDARSIPGGQPQPEQTGGANDPRNTE